MRSVFESHELEDILGLLVTRASLLVTRALLVASEATRSLLLDCSGFGEVTVGCTSISSDMWSMGISDGSWHFRQATCLCRTGAAGGAGEGGSDVGASE